MLIRHISLLFLIALSSCTILENEKIYFAFVRIENIVLENQQRQILPSKITDVWVYVDDQFTGVYPLPNTIPIPLQSANQRISIRAGIKPNGQNELSEEYPFFTSLDTTLALQNSQTILLSPRVRYRANCKFDIIENFEDSNIFTMALGNSTATSCLSRASSMGKDNSFGGIIDLNNAQKLCEVTHFNSYSNKNNLLGKVYLEMDYKGNEKFFVGTILQKATQLVKSYDIVIVENESWNRVYIDLTAKISKLDVDAYQIALSTLLDESKRSQARIHFDNIRLVHF